MVPNQPLLLTVVTFLPLLSVAALLLLRSDDHVWIRRIALTASLAEFAVSLLLLRGFDSKNAVYQFTEYHRWIGDTIHYHLGVDGISLFLVLLTLAALNRLVLTDRLERSTATTAQAPSPTSRAR